MSKLEKDAALRGAIVAARAQAHEEIAKALNAAVTHPKLEGGAESRFDDLIRSEPPGLNK
jgi:hypothetical protein